SVRRAASPTTHVGSAATATFQGCDPALSSRRQPFAENMTGIWRNIPSTVKSYAYFRAAKYDTRWVISMPVSSHARPATHVRHRAAFLLFWGGETVSMFGTQIPLLAMPLTAVLVLDATPAQLGLVRFFETFPYVLCTLIFGAWVDRRRR